MTQVALFEQTLVGKKPTLTAAHRRLVCFCRLYEIVDIIKREKLTAHQREVYLFNDLLIVSKRVEMKEGIIKIILDHKTLWEETSTISTRISSLWNEYLFI